MYFLLENTKVALTTGVVNLGTRFGFLPKCEKDLQKPKQPKIVSPAYHGFTKNFLAEFIL